jgi:hypothetical protein
MRLSRASLVVTLAIVAAAVNAASAATGIAGRVVDTGGGALPGVEVVAKPSRGGALAITMTKPDGSFNFDGLAIGSYDVLGTLRGFDAERLSGVEVGSTRATGIALVLRVSGLCDCVVDTGPPRHKVTGRVIDHLGYEMPFAVVTITSKKLRWSALGFTDLQGRFAARLTDGEYEMRAASSGFQESERQLLQVTGSGISDMTFQLKPAGKSTALVRHPLPIVWQSGVFERSVSRRRP